MSHSLVCTLTVTTDDAGAESVIALGRVQDDNYVVVARRRLPSYAAAIVTGTEIAQRTMTVMRSTALEKAGRGANDVIQIPLPGCTPSASDQEAAAAALRMFMNEARLCVGEYGGNATLAGLLSSFVNIAMASGGDLGRCADNLRHIADRLPDIHAKWQLANASPANATPA